MPAVLTSDFIKNCRRNDEIKNNYCINNEIPLLRISYLDIENTPKIVEEFIEKVFNGVTGIHYSSEEDYALL